MDAKDFVKELNEAQELMKNERYSEALIVLNKLKEADQAGEFDYNLTHKLYQLISNSRSFYNQQRILSVLKKISQDQKAISFLDLKVFLKEQEKFEIDEQILRREIEILILRSLLKAKLVGNDLIF
ncbi:MAG: hypothetical protein ACFE9R_14290 [Candidatus Hermodarchaeota archaeon]